MRSRHALGCVLIVAVVCVPRSSWCRAAVPDDKPAGNTVDSFRPTWHVGDVWVVETRTRRLQVGAQPGTAIESRPVTWQFAVRGVERINGRDCFQVEITGVSGADRSQPQATLWIDAQAMALRQFQTQVRVAGTVRTLTESYAFPGEQPTPVLGPLTALPIDLPLLSGGHAKGSQAFTYEATAGPSGSKAVGEPTFAYDVTQEFNEQPSAETRALLDSDFAKSLAARPLLEVRLKTVDRQVRQLWQPGLPWPVYSENGTTVARLVKWSPAPSSPTESR